MREKILVVDDDVTSLELLRLRLGKEGYEVFTARSGEEALQLCRQNMPDLVLLDLMMPGMDGFETCRRLKNMKEELAVIMLTASSDDVDKVVGFKLGIDDYQTKPYNFTELVLRIKAVLRRARNSHRSGEDSVLEYPGLVIDRGRRTVSVNSQPVELTPREFDLLWLLASHPNQVFSKQQLLDRLWDGAYFGDDNTVNVHIRRLREKIEENPSKPVYVKTVWGVGYKFELPQQ